VVLQERHALRLEKIAQPVLSPRLARLGQAEHELAGAGAEARLVEGGEHGDRLHERLAGAAGFRHRHEAARR
jgi:hypothetical protein